VKRFPDASRAGLMTVPSLELLETVEPLLRRAATYEIDTHASADEVVVTVLQLVE